MRLFASLFVSLYGTVAFAQSSEAVIDQVGQLHIAEIVQVSSVVSLVQMGTANVAYLDQQGLSMADILQDGTGNVLAGFDPLTGLADLAAFAVQTGGSTLLLSQTGTGNVAFVQQGNGAFAQITQNGTNNTATIRQN